MERLAQLVMHHRRIVSALWLALFVGGLLSASHLTDRWAYDFSLPGQPGDRAEQQLLDTYGVSSMHTYVALVTVPEGQTVAAQSSAVSQVFASATAAVPGVKLRLVDLASTGDRGFVTTDGRTTYALIQAPVAQTLGAYIETQLDPALAKAAAAQGFHSGLTGYGLLAAGGGSGGTGVLLEVLLAGAAALLVLLFVFASFLALLPLLIAGVSILTTFMLVLALTTFTDVSIIVQFLIALIGLGVAIDYSLLLVSRWREERAHGRTNEEAVVVAMKTAGHAVLASGVTVAVSLLALLVVPVPALRSVGLAGLLIALVSVSAVLTLLPALLSSIGPRVDYPRIRHEGNASRGWTALGPRGRQAPRHRHGRSRHRPRAPRHPRVQPQDRPDRHLGPGEQRPQVRRAADPDPGRGRDRCADPDRGARPGRPGATRQPRRLEASPASSSPSWGRPSATARSSTSCPPRPPSTTPAWPWSTACGRPCATPSATRSASRVSAPASVTT